MHPFQRILWLTFLVAAIAPLVTGSGTQEPAKASLQETAKYEAATLPTQGGSDDPASNASSGHVKDEAAKDQDTAAEPLVLTFGVYRSEKATTMYRQFTKIIERVQDDIEAKLSRAVDVRLTIFKNYDDANHAIVSGSVDFVRFGPASYIIAKSRNENLRLLAMEQKKGKKQFKGLIIVRADSPIHTIADLQGRSFAFGNENSTIGRYLAQAELVMSGIHAHDLRTFQYLGRHDKVVKAVAVGDFDAGSLKSGTYEKFEDRDLLRVLVSFDNVTQSWIAREGLDDAVFNAIQESLLRISDPNVLNDLKVSGFLPTSDGEYDFVRRGMSRANEFASEENIHEKQTGL